jgi:hypothetical protein
MSGFETLEGAINLSEALTPPIAEETAFADEELGDETALGMVLQDTDSALAYLNSKNLISSQDDADNLVRGYVRSKNWPGTEKLRSNLSMLVVTEAIEKILPALHMALWGSGKDPFEVSPIGKTKPEAARAKQSILRWAVKEAGLQEELRLSLKTCLQYGFTINSWGWEQKQQKRRAYKYDDAGKVVRDKELKPLTINCPTFSCLNLRNVLIDPHCDRQDISKGARFIIKRIAVSADDLDQLREDPTYKNIPSRDELRAILSVKAEPTADSMKAAKPNIVRDLQAEPDSNATSVNPLSQPLEILEWWSADRVIAVLQRKLLYAMKLTSLNASLSIPVPLWMCSIRLGVLVLPDCFRVNRDFKLAPSMHGLTALRSRSTLLTSS